MYHSCEWAKKIYPQNKIWFSSPSDATAHGYRPCKVCRPPYISSASNILGL
ncbi:MAG: hypothetical protein CMI54_02980 [Parcubacteria group bacterium]|nr:hypothetical protein [Parcubacteria group bacterium]